MTRSHLVCHLYDNNCCPVEDVPDVGELWINEINGFNCYVPHEEDLAVYTYCHILYQLQVDPPLINGYDSEYAIYASFREKQLANIIKAEE